MEGWCVFCVLDTRFHKNIFQYLAVANQVCTSIKKYFELDIVVWILLIKLKLVPLIIGDIYETSKQGNKLVGEIRTFDQLFWCLLSSSSPSLPSLSSVIFDVGLFWHFVSTTWENKRCFRCWCCDFFPKSNFPKVQSFWGCGSFFSKETAFESKMQKS